MSGTLDSHDDGVPITPPPPYRGVDPLWPPINSDPPPPYGVSPAPRPPPPPSRQHSPLPIPADHRGPHLPVVAEPPWQWDPSATPERGGQWVTSVSSERVGQGDAPAIPERVGQGDAPAIPESVGQGDAPAAAERILPGHAMRATRPQEIVTRLAPHIREFLQDAATSTSPPQNAELVLLPAAAVPAGWGLVPVEAPWDSGYEVSRRLALVDMTSIDVSGSGGNSGDPSPPRAMYAHPDMLDETLSQFIGQLTAVGERRLSPGDGFFTSVPRRNRRDDKWWWNNVALADSLAWYLRSEPLDSGTPESSALSLSRWQPPVEAGPVEVTWTTRSQVVMIWKGAARRRGWGVIVTVETKPREMETMGS